MNDMLCFRLSKLYLLIYDLVNNHSIHPIINATQPQHTTIHSQLRAARLRAAG